MRERRDQLRHPNYVRPELLASVPNQVGSWDLTKLRRPAKWTCYQLDVILDIYSRYVVGWMVAERESARLAAKPIEQTLAKQGVDRDRLTTHADRGSSMTSKDVACLLADLGVTKTHSRPHVSNDNPYSEAHFKTLTYRPEFPERFGSSEDARAFCRAFFDGYNRSHRHSGIAMMTPHDVHHGRADEIVARRSALLALAHQRHPERFVQGSPAAPRQSGPASINPPTNTPQLAAAAQQSPLSGVSKSLTSTGLARGSVVRRLAPHAEFGHAAARALAARWTSGQLATSPVVRPSVRI